MVVGSKIEICMAAQGKHKYFFSATPRESISNWYVGGWVERERVPHQVPPSTIISPQNPSIRRQTILTPRGENIHFFSVKKTIDPDYLFASGASEFSLRFTIIQSHWYCATCGTTPANIVIACVCHHCHTWVRLGLQACLDAQLSA